MATLVEKYKATFTAEEIDEIWTQWVLAGTSWQNFQGPAQVMKSVKDANGNWLYSEGCIDPELADAGEPDDPDGVPNMDMGGMGKKKKKVRTFCTTALHLWQIGTPRGAAEPRSRSSWFRADRVRACPQEKPRMEPVAFRPGDLKEGESIQDAIKRGAAQKLDAWPPGHPMASP